MEENRTAERCGTTVCSAPEHSRLARMVLERVSRLAFRSVLNVGCGSGELLELLLAERGEIRAEGIDLSERKIENARGRLEGRAELTVGDAENLPDSDGSFDLLICGDLLRRCPNPARAFNQFYRVLRRGGTLLLCGCGRPTAGQILVSAVARYGRDAGLRYTPKELRAFLEGSAFRDLTWEAPFKNGYLATGKK